MPERKKSVSSSLTKARRKCGCQSVRTATGVLPDHPHPHHHHSERVFFSVLPAPVLKLCPTPPAVQCCLSVQVDIVRESDKHIRVCLSVSRPCVDVYGDLGRVHLHMPWACVSIQGEREDFEERERAEVGCLVTALLQAESLYSDARDAASLSRARGERGRPGSLSSAFTGRKIGRKSALHQKPPLPLSSESYLLLRRSMLPAYVLLCLSVLLCLLPSHEVPTQTQIYGMRGGCGRQLGRI